MLGFKDCFGVVSDRVMIEASCRVKSIAGPGDTLQFGAQTQMDARKSYSSAGANQHRTPIQQCSSLAEVPNVHLKHQELFWDMDAHRVCTGGSQDTPRIT